MVESVVLCLVHNEMMDHFIARVQDEIEVIVEGFIFGIVAQCFREIMFCFFEILELEVDVTEIIIAIDDDFFL